MRLFKKKKTIATEDILFALYDTKDKGTAVILDPHDLGRMISSFVAVAYQNPAFARVLRVAVRSLDVKQPILEELLKDEEKQEAGEAQQ